MSEGPWQDPFMFFFNNKPSLFMSITNIWIWSILKLHDQWNANVFTVVSVKDLPFSDETQTHHSNAVRDVTYLHRNAVRWEGPFSGDGCVRYDRWLKRDVMVRTPVKETWGIVFYAVSFSWPWRLGRQQTVRVLSGGLRTEPLLACLLTIAKCEFTVTLCSTLCII